MRVKKCNLIKDFLVHRTSYILFKCTIYEFRSTILFIRKLYIVLRTSFLMYDLRI